VFVVGLTGGIGSGKSTVGKLFRELGITVVDSDQVAREVVKPGSAALRKIARHFGEGILLDDDTLNRAKLRQLIFQSEKEKTWLESLLHPIIRRETQLQLERSESPYAVLESPLLLEMGQDRIVDRVLVVDVPEDIQIARAMARDNNTEKQIKSIIKAQISRPDRLKRADDRIDNSSDIDSMEKQVTHLHSLYLELSTSPPE